MKIPKEDLQVLRAIAAKLDPLEETYTIRGQAIVKGKDLKLGGEKEATEQLGTIVDDKDYRLSSPVDFEVNHLRRLKKAYKRNGMEGVKEYTKPYVYTIETINRITDPLSHLNEVKFNQGFSIFTNATHDVVQHIVNDSLSEGATIDKQRQAINEINESGHGFKAFKTQKEAERKLKKWQKRNLDQ